MSFVVKSEPCWTNEFEGAVTGAVRNARLEVVLQHVSPDGKAVPWVTAMSSRNIRASAGEAAW